MNATIAVEEPEKWKKCLTLSVLFVISIFLLGFIFGSIGAYAVPGIRGWEPWRVGLLVAAVSAAVATVIAIVGSAIHISGF